MPQRSKEVAADYRYMPEPDLPPLRLTDDFIATEAAKLPMMPNDYRKLFTEIIAGDILEILLDYPTLMKKLQQLASDFFGADTTSTQCHARIMAPSPVATSEHVSKALSLVANLFASVLLAEEKSAEYLNDLPSTEDLIELARMNEEKELSSTATKEVFLKLFDPQMKGRGTSKIAKEMGLIQENDVNALEKMVDVVLAKPETKKAQEDFKSGQEKVLGFLVGQVMKESRGKANPSSVQEILRNKLKS